MRGSPVRVAQGALAGIDYGMPKLVPITTFKDPNFVRSANHSACMVLKVRVSQQHRCVLIRSNFPAVPKPFREFITCIQAIFMKLILFWHVKPFYKKYFTHMENTRAHELTGRPSLIFSKCFSRLSDDLVTRSG
ncbi:hypothetical protein M9H77_18052 [Catharanthus roseus]|uniref:Uncharacterized protein n=1 Tax=Catharanthus roseus TaxID=4058 RepID=A0ACC0B6E5_CATRO|nr:hypothetical protein M9H77_18052 [Catharanthus roseus]